MDTDQSIPQFRDNATTRSHDIFFIYSQLPFKYRASARVSRINICQISVLLTMSKRDTRIWDVKWKEEELNSRKLLQVNTLCKYISLGNFTFYWLLISEPKIYVYIFTF